jgi:uncharacterized protein (TIGR01777 family)
MRIAVTGATGFVGRHLLPLLSLRGHELVVLTRSPEKAKAVIPVPCTVHGWDGRSVAPGAALAGTDAVIHLAGEGVAERRWSAAQKRRILESRTLGARGLVSAIAGLARRPRLFLSASAIGYYGPRGDEILTEASSQGGGFLADVCAAWEAEVKPAAAMGLREARIRVGVVLGEEGGALKKLIPVFRTGFGGPVGAGRQWMSWIHVEDLAELFVAVLESDSACGIYNGVGPAPATNAEFSRALGNALGKPSWFRAPAFALRLAMGEMASLVLDSQRVLPERAKELAFAFRYPSLAPALAAICARAGTDRRSPVV